MKHMTKVKSSKDKVFVSDASEDELKKEDSTLSKEYNYLLNMPIS